MSVVLKKITDVSGVEPFLLHGFLHTEEGFYTWNVCDIYFLSLYLEEIFVGQNLVLFQNLIFNVFKNSGIMELCSLVVVILLIIKILLL